MFWEKLKATNFSQLGSQLAVSQLLVNFSQLENVKMKDYGNLQVDHLVNRTELTTTLCRGSQPVNSVNFSPCRKGSGVASEGANSVFGHFIGRG